MTLLQITPRVNGLSFDPRTCVSRPSATVTVRLHVSGQSSGHTAGSWVSGRTGLKILAGCRMALVWRGGVVKRWLDRPGAATVG